MKCGWRVTCSVPWIKVTTVSCTNIFQICLHFVHIRAICITKPRKSIVLTAWPEILIPFSLLYPSNSLFFDFIRFRLRLVQDHSRALGVKSAGLFAYKEVFLQRIIFVLGHETPPFLSLYNWVSLFWMYENRMSTLSIFVESIYTTIYGCLPRSNAQFR